MAVIGASSVPFKWGYDTISSLQQAGYKGAIYPINPRESQILGLPVYRNVLDVAGEIDLGCAYHAQRGAGLSIRAVEVVL